MLKTNYFTNYWCSKWLLVSKKMMLVVDSYKNHIIHKQEFGSSYT